MAFVARGFESADLLLRGFEPSGEVLLREARLFAERGKLQGYVPSFARPFEALRELRVAELFLQISIEVGSTTHVFLSSQSRIRRRAVSRSRAGIACPLLRMPCTATMRRLRCNINIDV